MHVSHDIWNTYLCLFFLKKYLSIESAFFYSNVLLKQIFCLHRRKFTCVLFTLSFYLILIWNYMRRNTGSLKIVYWNFSIVTYIVPCILRILLNDILSSTQFPDNSIYEVIQATDIHFAENTILEVEKMNIEIREITRERSSERESI